MKRLYIIVRQDLPPGLALAQACHSAAKHAVVDPEWEDNLVVLGARNEEELASLAELLDVHGVPCSRFHEQDCGGELTSCVARGDARGLLRHLPLALGAE